MHIQAEVFLHFSDTRLGEGPVWDHRSQVLYWVNIMLGRLHRYDSITKEHQSRSFGQYLGAAVPALDGEIVLAMQNGFYFYDWEFDKLSAIHDPEKDKMLNRFNDGKCDPHGRFWAGSMRIKPPRDPDASLYCLNTDLQVSEKMTAIYISNGLAWNKAGDTMYYIDTLLQNVQAFDFVGESGEITNPRVVLNFGGEEYPDGMCIDEADNLWIAFYGAGKLACYDPILGKKLAEVSVPAKRTTSCCFGGAELDTLFITSAREKDDTEKHAGALFIAKPGVKGREANFFKKA